MRDQSHRVSRSVRCVGQLLFLAALWAGDRSWGYDRPAGQPHQSRSAVIARNGMVATSQPLAAQVGLDVLQAGGNAADAAIAASAMLGVVEPMSCGIGGDLFALYWDNTARKLYGLNASGRSPFQLSREVFTKKEMTEIPIEGPLSWSVPGCVSGWDMLSRRFGTQSLDQLLAPAIDTAEAGFPVTQIIAAEWQGAETSLKRWPDAADTYLIAGRAPREGEIFRNRRLANVYREIARRGSDAFYRGSIAQRIVEFGRQHGGFLETRDFAEHTAEWVEPVSTTYRGYRVWQMPPNGQGIAVLQILNLLEPFELGGLSPGDADYLHLFVETKKLAYADRARYYADPAMSDVPVTELISKAYAARQSRRLDTNRAADHVAPGDPKLSSGETIYLAVVDRDRNACSLIQSIYHGFGSKVVPGDVGFAMQNRGSLFSLDAQHPNRLEPHKRPFHTIIPAMVTHNDLPWLCFGVMGGDMQPQGQVQVLVGMIDFGLTIQEAADSARIRHDGSPTPTGTPANNGGTVTVESRISDQAIEALRRRGHRVRRGVGGMGGFQGILIDHEQGTLHGGTEPRKDGAAVGY
jgi:gamma-glutamyltranspeptidase/glutathione hydrolase